MMTRQRMVILEELKKIKTHPTADEVYEQARQRLPRISLGTVYRNLEVLSGCGLIQKLELGGTQKRYDGNVGNHQHIRCVRCGCIEDVWLEIPATIKNALHEACDYEIIGIRLEYIGVCPGCKGRP